MKQQLDIWIESHRFGASKQKVPFENIYRILPSIIYYWNKTKGSVDRLSQYLPIIHASPYRCINQESVLWDRCIVVALLNLFHLYKWSCLSEEAIRNSRSFAHLQNISQHGNTFKSFVSKGMLYFRRRCEDIEVARNVAPAAAVLQRPRSRRNVINFYNSLDGHAMRSNRQVKHSHIILIRRKLCMLCKLRKGTTSCVNCPDVILCATIKPNHPCSPGDNTSCFEIFHRCNGDFVLGVEPLEPPLGLQVMVRMLVVVVVVVVVVLLLLLDRGSSTVESRK